MNNKYIFRKYMLSIMILCLFCLMGCGKKEDANGTKVSEDGRQYGATIKADMKDTVSTAFFDLHIDKAVKCDTYQFEDGLYQADEGKTYLVVTYTITNTYAENLSMGITDFTLNYEDNSSTDIITGYGKNQLNKDDFMENLFTLKEGESITKSVLYTVEDKEEYFVCYTEYYEDKFEGNKYEIHINPEVLSEQKVEDTTTQ